MKLYLLWLRSRNLQVILPWLLLLAAAAMLFGDRSFPVNASWLDSQRRVPLLETGCVLMAALLGYGCRATLWQAEHLSVRRLRLLTGGLALLLAILPIGTVMLAAARVPGAGAWDAYVSTVMTLTGISLAIGPLVTPALSWAAPLSMYLATIIVHVTAKGWGERWWPLADPRVEGHDRWLLATAVLIVGIMSQAVTRGGSIASSQRLASEH